jgi:hypothetical protein
VQFALPERLYQPEGQGNGIPVTLGQYLPAAHDTQGSVGDSTNWPEEQGVQTKAPDKETEPEGHN